MERRPVGIGGTILNRTPKGSKTTSLVTNGHALRKCPSWIESFVEYTKDTEAPEIFRRWAAITIVASVLREEVWIKTTAPLYPNLYTFLVGPPGTGKSRTIKHATDFVRDMPDFHIGDTSMTMASMVDKLKRSKRIRDPFPEPPTGVPREYNTMLLPVDEMSVFMGKYDEDIMGGLTKFYDADVPYVHSRRGLPEPVKLMNPQLTILCGTTESNLMKFMPETAWDQGFTSRIIMVHSDKIEMVADIFDPTYQEMPQEMIHDIHVISSQRGEIRATAGYAKAVNAWRQSGRNPSPSHPRLTHYCARRDTHLMKLSMISAIDRGPEVLSLLVEDYERAMEWLLEAEATMPKVFEMGSVVADAKIMDEIYHFVALADRGQGVHESKIIRLLSTRLPAMTVERVMQNMINGQMIKAISIDVKAGGMKNYAVIPR